MITVMTASLVLGVAAAGVAALPWRDAELVESSRAWSDLFAIVVGARREVRVSAAGDADALIPAPLPRPSARRAVTPRRQGLAAG